MITETYSLREASLPSIPTPHDCEITAIREEGQDLVFLFEEEGLSKHDAIQAIHPEAKKLVMRFRMDAKDLTVFQLLEQKYRHHDDFFEIKKYKRLFKLPDQHKNLVYLYHYVAYGQIIIAMISDRASIQLTVSVDQVTLEWTDA